MTESAIPDLNWLLNDFAARVPEITHAVAVSADGLLIAATRGVEQELGDQLAAIASGLVSLLAGAGRVLEVEPVISNLTELKGGFLFSMAVSSGASLLVLASKACDIGQVSYEMAELINRVGPALTPAAREALLNSASHKVS